jgi:NitT/TauT family transport system substrate-binding protein
MRNRRALMAGLVAGIAMFAFGSAQAAERCHVAWSHYTGWEPLGWIQKSGLAKKWGEKYGVDLKFTLVNDYIESITQYTAGAFDGVASANVEALLIPGIGGVDTTVLIVGDYSDGNDGVLINAPKGARVEDLKGKLVQLVTDSVSHLALVRALGTVGLSEKDVKTRHVSDADIGGLIAASRSGDVFVTWNPMLMTGRNVKGMVMVFDSSRIPGEIIDTVLVRTSASPACKKAVTGAWYDAMKVMSGVGPEASAMRSAMAEQAGGSEGEFSAQLKTTRMFYDPAEAVAVARAPKVKETMAIVAKLLFDHGLYKEAKNEQSVGIAYPDASTWGNPKNVKIRFDATYMELAAKGSL